MKTQDSDLRKMLHLHLNAQKDPNDLIIDEMGICQSIVIADVVLINDKLHGYEIKSERDTLSRLERQMYYYNQVFDTINMVISPIHLKEVMDVVPDWWGIIVADYHQFQVFREAKDNLNNSSLGLAQLLWREEAMNLLKAHNLQRGLSGKARRFIWERIAQSLPKEEIHSYVIHTLKSRTNWRKPNNNRLKI